MWQRMQRPSSYRSSPDLERVVLRLVRPSWGCLHLIFSNCISSIFASKTQYFFFLVSTTPNSPYNSHILIIFWLTFKLDFGPICKIVDGLKVFYVLVFIVLFNGGNSGVVEAFSIWDFLRAVLFLEEDEVFLERRIIAGSDDWQLFVAGELSDGEGRLSKEEHYEGECQVQCHSFKYYIVHNRKDPTSFDVVISKL